VEVGVSLEKTILAIITTQRDGVSGGAPIFFAKDKEALQKISFTLEKILDGIAHQVNEETMIIVKHF
jgi:hypothetical protein